jgi:oleandomycin transport system permease protein
VTAVTATRTARHVSAVAAVRHGATLAWRSLVKIKSSPEQLIDVTLQPIIFLLLFVYVFGGAIAGGGDTTKYLQFLLPGLLVQTALFSTMGTGYALNSDISKGVFDRFRSLPISRIAPLAGAVVGDIARYTVSIVVLVAAGMVMGFRIHTDPLSVLAACLLVLAFSLALGWVSIFIGMLAPSPQSVQGFGMIFMFPLTFGSSIFAPAGSMPGWLQAWVKINPVTKLADATRGLMTGGAVLDPVLYSLGWAVVIVAIFAPLAMRLYRRKTS